MSFLQLDQLRKSFGATQVVRNFDLEIEQGEFVSLLGPSGCGKTTVLRMIAGFEAPSHGAIRVGGDEVTHKRPNQRNVGMVFQSYALFPNLTVAQNVAFGLRVKGAGKAQRAARVAEMLSLVGLVDFGNRYPFQLSGGQQQRVALARALAVQPRVLLLDEPLSALDAKIRVSLREEIREIQKRLGITTVFVTHDQEEALSMSDRIVVMNGGVAQQVGTPHEIYSSPANRFVAEFVGRLNVLDAEVTDPATGRVSVGGTEISMGRPLGAGTVPLALRPEAISLGPAPGHDVSFRGTVDEVQFLGSVIRVGTRLGAAQVLLDTFNRTGRKPPRLGEELEFSFSSVGVILLD
ncbi:spermidine/putrescine ABC transporter ATP-binding protein [Salipiger aestuarii]|uniref:Putative spermidine/putrescine transport system ATP-binding protein n=1 Tax=Salipiger aestuarii TaxID=568098 RepID=A0A327YS67_9RHOB|nr:ABC transporter ATP-binding protein [Salipiger aestuarii]EIE49146.1 ABC transporter ATP-binding protein [Citreicella sp. 357]KAA8609673.1 spermidine/putrescine ABC transporter ATP-binding protein [Salipiger aestuarii]KAA8614005.1 spermidine/putrescine ABC transporter ATP-binding protein [Salipiger aestuarii]KAB2543699.1 spermidine/putrescine ABC transporter ATP-binding protein [Salipiger aestuarii]RAK22937.1 putative spermidine/putrescine transport system ATP-binding protein [Salipiger aest